MVGLHPREKEEKKKREKKKKKVRRREKVAGQFKRGGVHTLDSFS